jgi:hypothetical protein
VVFYTLMKKTIKINMSVLVTFVQSTMDIVSLDSTTQKPNAKSSFSFHIDFFDTLILASLARTGATEKGEGGGREPHLLDQICMEFNFRIEKLAGKKYRDSGLHARQ